MNTSNVAALAKASYDHQSLADSDSGEKAWNVHVTVIHVPIHIGCFLQAPTSVIGNGDTSNGVSDPGSNHAGCCSAFTLASPACARIFPLRRCDLQGGGGQGVSAAMISAAGAAERNGSEGVDGKISAEDVPREERLRYR